jgi:hypothetical protein
MLIIGIVQQSGTGLALTSQTLCISLDRAAAPEQPQAVLDQVAQGSGRCHPFPNLFEGGRENPWTADLSATEFRESPRKLKNRRHLTRSCPSKAEQP